MIYSLVIVCMNTIYLDYIHTCCFLFDSSHTTLSSQLLPVLLFFFFFPLSFSPSHLLTQCCWYAHGCRAPPSGTWTAYHTAAEDCLLLPFSAIADSSLPRGEAFLLRAGILTGLTLCRSRAVSHGFCEVMSVQRM